jgi:hypothetical protein
MVLNRSNLAAIGLALVQCAAARHGFDASAPTMSGRSEDGFALLAADGRAYTKGGCLNTSSRSRFDIGNLYKRQKMAVRNDAIGLLWARPAQRAGGWRAAESRAAEPMQRQQGVDIRHPARSSRAPGEGWDSRKPSGGFC